jgi:heme exporter protein A
MLSARELACERGERLLFRSLGFELGRGEILLVRGGNGRGKTSLLRILCGLSLPAAGQVNWRGQPIRSAHEQYGREVAYVGHANGIKDDLTPIENLRIAAALGGRVLDDAAAIAALGMVGLSRCVDLPARVLSFGQTGLDVDGVAIVERMIGDHVAAGGMAVMTTHQPLALGGLTPQALSVGE